MTTKEKILASALKLFAKQGIDKTSTAQITRDVGVAEGTLFVHFKTKQDLIDGLYIQIKKNSMASLAGLVNPKVSAEKNFKAIAKGLIEHYANNFSEFVFIEQLERDPKVSKKALRAAQKEYAGIVKVMQQWQKEGKIKNIELDLLGGIIWNLCTSIIRFYKANKTKKAQNTHLDIIWEAVKK